MKHMKKVLSLCLALTVILASFAFAPTAAHAWEAHTNAVDLRVGLINDSHVTANGGDPVNKLKTALSTFKTLGGNKLDGLALVGDVIYYPSASSDPTDQTPYNLVYGTIEETGYAKEDVIAYAMGNHEFPQSNVDVTVSNTAISTFETCTGFDMNHHTVKEGFHFIAGGAKDYNGTATAETQAWLMAEIDKALAEDSTNDVDGTFAEGVIPDSKKPVFLLLHHPIDGTIFNASGDKYTDEFVAFLKNRPQIVNLTAHWHSPAQLPDNIWQDGFTAYQAPLIGGGYLEEVGATSTGNLSGYSQGSMLEVSGNVVSIYRMDYITGEYIGMPWVIDIPAIVADRLDSDASNDKAHMTYSADKHEGANAPAFPEGSELTTSVEGDTLTVTYPNNAVMTATGNGELQDDFVRAHKIEVVTEGGTVVRNATFMTDFYKAAANRAEKFTRTVSGLTPGMKYTVKVYPMSPLKVLGEPLTAAIETEALELNENAIRYEFEDYCTTHTNIIRESEFASGKAFLYSAYNTAWIPTSSLVNTNDSNNTNTEANDNIPLVYDFKVNVPYDCAYDVNFAISDYAGDWVSKVYVSVDGDEIGNGDGTVTTSLAQDGTYPYANTPLALFTKENLELTAGEHVVTLTIDEPKANTTGAGNQPYLFCADYIEFIPKMQILNAKNTTRMEMEDYANDFSIRANSVKSSANCSKGKYVHWDTNYDANFANSVLEIPVMVEVAGPYKVEYIASAVGSNVDVYLDGTQIDTSTKTVSTESKPEGADNYPYFNEYHHSGNKYAFSYNFPAGKHTLKIELTNRKGSNGDVAICMDYIDFTYNGLTVGKEAPFKFAFYDYKDNFSPATSPWNHASTYKGTLAYKGGGDTTTFTMPMALKDGGVYDFEFVGAYSSGLSKIKFYLDSTDSSPIYTIDASNTNYIDLSVDSTVYQTTNGWLAKQYNFMVNMTDGGHTLYVVAESRGASGVAYAWDYLDIKYHEETISAKEATRLEIEDYATWVTVAETDGTDAKAWVGTGGGDCSEGKYFGVDTNDGLAVDEYIYINIPVKIEQEGIYAFEYVGNTGTSPVAFFLDSTATTALTATASETVLETEKVDGIYQYFQSSWATAKKYSANALLPEGDHTLIIQFKRRNEKDFARYLDYAQFTPKEAAVVKADGKSVAEFENYSIASIAKDLSYASGGAMAYNSYTSKMPVVNMPLTVEESGYYNVSYVIGNNAVTLDGAANGSIDYLSRTLLYLDGKQFGDSEGAFTENLGNIYTLWQTAPVCRYETVLYLEKGDHVITADIGITADKQYKYQLDYISFAPVDSLTVEGTTAKATATFKEAVTGKVILALYNGKEMISVNMIDVENKETVSLTAPVPGTFTHAKVFAWSDLTAVTPLTEEINLTVAE
ncbi:MAG: hypothetical protein IJC78_01905 [Clostridia bacterium]|nr:hypothetical protein [Clostridia bacterium]